MANHKGIVPKFLSADYLQNILQKIEHSPDLKVLKVNITPGSAEGDNYSCQIFRIQVQYEINKEEKQISLIGKYKVKTKLVEGFDSVQDPFAIEANFFSEIPALFKTVLSKREFEFLPKCLYLDRENNLILMEDLVALKYKLQPKGTYLNTKQCAMVIESLAEMHGASFEALKTNPSLKDKYSKSVFKDKTEGPLKTIFDNGIKCLEKCIKIYGLPRNLEEELLKLKVKLDVNWFSVCDLKEDHLNFLLHGDCWLNNMMFHSNGDKVKLLDFQLYTYNCFANDLQYFLFTSADPEVIINDIDFLLQTYFERLRSVAPDIPNLTLDRVKKEFSERYFFGYTMTTLFRPASSANPPPDMEKIMEGKEMPMGYDGDVYVKHLPILMEYFNKVGLF